ncbi:MAG: sulfurtransferase TusA family protein [Candidatus Aramenus sulfurataquae]|jgi:tRNA 2-thiouridine synthesizing protein A|uniref:UPF0033 domain-containing protein n=2 Tax=Candidatus Aramenus sulfurataquae TaxID=1326980 RepID=A0A0F2LPI3_9CREN|nr:sulfurtransferase TusA family protein [Candidatus Aramenus sp.]
MKTTLDLTGLCCSVPQLMVYSKVKKMVKGDVVEVIVETGSSQEQDVINVIRHFSLEYKVLRQGDKSVYLITK